MPGKEVCQKVRHHILPGRNHGNGKLPHQEPLIGQGLLLHALDLPEDPSCHLRNFIAEWCYLQLPADDLRKGNIKLILQFPELDGNSGLCQVQRLRGLCNALGFGDLKKYL